MNPHAKYACNGHLQFEPTCRMCKEIRDEKARRRLAALQREQEFWKKEDEAAHRERNAWRHEQ